MSPNEFLPLYYGALAINDRAEFIRVNSETISRALAGGERFKLVLRPPSSINVTELQVVAWHDPREVDIIRQSVRAISRSDQSWRISFRKKGSPKTMEKTIEINSLAPVQVFYLLKIGLDIFGLIEEGWAVNETTLNKTKGSLTPWKIKDVIGPI